MGSISLLLQWDYDHPSYYTNSELQKVLRSWQSGSVLDVYAVLWRGAGSITPRILLLLLLLLLFRATYALVYPNYTHSNSQHL
jgi:hypothetical protein